jgi:hypothetical protein
MHGKETGSMRRNILTAAIAIAIGLFASLTWAQNSDRITAANPAATYLYLKQAMINAGGPSEIGVRKNDSFTTLTSCDDASTLIGYDGNQRSVMRRAAELAYDVLYMQGEIKQAGYPWSLWEPEIQAYEQTHLRNIRTFEVMWFSAAGSRDKQAIAAKLNKYRQQHPTERLQRIMAGAEGCGAGEVDVRLVTAPKAQRVQYINSIKYDLCASQGLNPRGTDCNHWVDYTAGNGGALMSGRYSVRVIWSDGTTDYRDLNVDDLPGDKNGVYSFAIRK